MEKTQLRKMIKARKAADSAAAMLEYLRVLRNDIAALIEATPPEAGQCPVRLPARGIDTFHDKIREAMIDELTAAGCTVLPGRSSDNGETMIVQWSASPEDADELRALLDAEDAP